MEVLIEAAKSGNFLLFAVGFIVILLGVIAYQWKYTNDKTVPKWIYEKEHDNNVKLINMIESLTSSTNNISKGVSDLTLIIQERLKP